MANLPKRIDPPERWKPVRGFEGRYEVSTMGRVRMSWPGAREPRMLIQNHRHTVERALAGGATKSRCCGWWPRVF